MPLSGNLNNNSVCCKMRRYEIIVKGANGESEMSVRAIE